MDRERLAWLRLAAATADALVLGGTWAAVVLARAGVGGALPPLPADVVLPLGWLVVPLWLAVLAAGGSYRGLRRQGLWPLAAQLATHVGQALLVALLLLFLARIDVNRTLLLGFAAASWPALLASRAAQTLALRALRRRAFDPYRVTLVAAGDDVARLEAALSARADWGIRVVDRVEPDQAAALGQRLKERPADEVFVAGALTAPVLVSVAAACEEVGVPLSLDATFLGPRVAHAELQDLESWTAITLRAAPESSPDRLIKRAVDLVGASLGLVVLGPALLALAAAVRLSDGGPALFVQERVGRYGRPFRMLKLRTMVPGAEARLAELRDHNEVRGPAFKMRGDPRVTRLGAWLRRLSLDELPQLVNVLRGEMSLVGPRPPLPAEVAAYEPWQLRRLSVRPGMTGLWQVSGRADLPFERWMALDLQYVDEWSLWLDLRVLARTLPAVLTGTGAR
jgi:exopolysaccharide biosynthesis polyprenyl glycosylphosphotransferase